MAEHPVKIYHSALLHPLKIVGAGLSIMGKFPLVATDEIRYADPGEYQNWPASKGVLMARFNVNGMMLDVYTTHIAAGRSPDSMRAKHTQTEEILKFVLRTSPPENAVILLGDFNMRPSRGPEDKEANKDNPKVVAFDREAGDPSSPGVSRVSRRNPGYTPPYRLGDSKTMRHTGVYRARNKPLHASPV